MKRKRATRQSGKDTTEEEEAENVEEAAKKARSSKKTNCGNAKPVRRSSRLAATVQDEDEEGEEKEEEENKTTEEKKPEQKPRPTLGKNNRFYIQLIQSLIRMIADVQKTSSALNLKKLDCATVLPEEELPDLNFNPETGEVADRWVLLKHHHFSFVNEDILKTPLVHLPQSLPPKDKVRVPTTLK